MSEKQKLFVDVAGYRGAMHDFHDYRPATDEQIAAAGYVPAERLEEEKRRTFAKLNDADARFASSEEAYESKLADVTGKLEYAELRISQYRDSEADWRRKLEAAEGLVSQWKDVASWLLRCGWYLPQFVRDRIENLGPAPEAAKPAEPELRAPATLPGSRVRVVYSESDNNGALGYVVEHDPKAEHEWRVAFDETARNDGDVWFSRAELDFHPEPASPPSPAQAEPCACGTVEAWHNPGCVLYPEGGYPADQPWRGPPRKFERRRCDRTQGCELAGGHLGMCREPQPPAAPGTPLTVEAMCRALRETPKGDVDGFIYAAYQFARKLADELERAQKGGG